MAAGPGDDATMRRLWIVLSALLAWLSASARVRADDFPKPYDSEKNPGSPMAPAEAAAGFRVPPGFRVSVFAAEPEVRNPIAMAWDARGRLWVAENYTYAERTQKFDLSLRDRVLIFEDADGDGRADRRSVFTDTVQRLTSVEVGHGGAWLLCPPELLFVPDRDGDGAPDGAVEVVLDGFTVPPENYHNFANGLRWGPDGWLYGRCGASSPGRLGAPGTPEGRRMPLLGGLWRYHPTRRTVEALCHGTTNPWGHDWNALGEAFFINTVNGHLWHAVAGAHFVRPHTIDPNPYTYELIDQHADHWHWDNSKDWTDSRNVSGEHDRRGGGHAHSGMMIYLADQWPDEYRGGLFTLNLHGRRLNFDALERFGCGYVGRHRPDLFFASDPWFRGIEIGYGPDGAVFVLDWSDTGECHENTGVHRSSGRIYKLSYGDPKPAAAVDLARLGARAMVDLHGHPNEWYVRQARLELAGHAAQGVRLVGIADALRERSRQSTDPVQALRALWTLHAIGAADHEFLVAQLGHDHETIRAWAVRLLTDSMTLDTAMSRRPGQETPVPAGLLDALARLAREDRSGMVRLVLASTLQRLPVPARPALAAPLLARSEDANDHNIPLMLWYGLIPLAESDPSALAKLGAVCALPTTRRLIARRLAEDIEESPGPLDDLLVSVSTSDSAAFRADVLRGLAEGLRGRHKAPKPAPWDAVVGRVGGSDGAEVVRDLSVLFGDGRALKDVVRLALDGAADLNTRKAALETLIATRPPELRQVCERLLRVRFLNATAARGLARFDDPAVARALVDSYRTFHPSERPALLDALVSRPAFARALLDRMATGAIPREALTAFQARQVRSLGDPDLSRRLSEVWGEVRDSDTDKRAAIAALKRRLTPAALASADPGKGRAVFEKVCASCHTLYGRGGDAGPDLTGAGRHDLDYLLENILDPSATVTADFRMVAVATADGRVLNGIVGAKTDRTLTLRTPTGPVTLERGAIDEVRLSPSSLMPDGLLGPLAHDQVRDLFAYLMSHSQVPLPADASAAARP
jgi:putative membrane-bound dehydrogenase-like protein